MLPKLITSLPGPKARAIIERDDQVISPSYTRSYPLVAEKGEGAIVEDPDGNRFLDFAAGIAVVATGHCHPRVVKAIQDQAAKLIHMSGTDFYYENMVALAEKLASLVPEELVHDAFTLAIQGPKRSRRRSSWRATTPGEASSWRSWARSMEEPWARWRSRQAKARSKRGSFR